MAEIGYLGNNQAYLTQGATIQPLEESGSYQGGTYTQIATTMEQANQVILESGVIYEQRISFTEPISAALITAWTGAILTLQELFGMIDVTYWKTEEKELVWQFMIPAGQAVGQVAVTLGTAIAIIIGIIAAFAIISWVVFRVDVFGVETILKLIPGMVVTAVGGVVMSVLPGKAKIAGVVPIGIGLYLLLQPFLPPPPEPPPTEYTVDVTMTVE